MAPGRPLKRQKTNPTEEPASEPPRASEVPLPSNTSPRIAEPQPSQTPTQDSPRSSWYSRTWPRKAAPIAEVARETISTAGSAAAEVASITTDSTTERRGSARSPSLAMTLGKSKSNRSLPVDAMTSKINATPNSTSPSRKNSRKTSLPGVAGGDESRKVEEQPSAQKVGQGQTNLSSETANGEISRTQSNGSVKQPLSQLEGEKDAQSGRASWLGWLSGGGETPTKPTISSTAPEANVNISEPPKIAEPASQATQPSEDQRQAEDSSATPNNKRSWLQMWGTDSANRPTTPKGKESSETLTEEPPIKTASLKIPQSQPKSTSTSQASSIETAPPPLLPGDVTKSSGWVFWSRDRKGNTSTSTEDRPHVGEIAISDTPSQTRPKRASISLPEKDKPDMKTAKLADGPKKAPLAKAESTNSVEKEQVSGSKVDSKGPTKQDSKTTKAESSQAAASVREPLEVTTPRPASPAPLKKVTENLLLPAFTETISLPENPSILQQLARLLNYTSEPELRHLSLVKDPPKIRNALAIGVHGYFPAPLIRTVLGQPTGTSIKFADMAAKSIKKWTRGHGYDCQVKTAALEGEGKIAERIELLWKLLLNWIDEIRKSDFVMVACHSQGVPVAIMLVAKLIQFGCVSGARVGICAMAGVNMGPFPEFKSRWISGSAGELFEFTDPDSKVSRDYLAAIEVVLNFGARLTFIGSIDDQLVSLESSIFSPITHPHIYRAVSIDARVHAPNFISHLVGFALKLRNLGVQDHGLIRELSSPLAGSLYSGEGHSRLYEYDAVYDLAVAFALETSVLPNVPVSRRSSSSTTGNPYILPFAMRGILEEDFVKTELQGEAAELLKQFDEWKPTTKVLKDVKFRLEGIRSRL